MAVTTLIAPTCGGPSYVQTESFKFAAPLFFLLVDKIRLLNLLLVHNHERVKTNSIDHLVAKPSASRGFASPIPQIVRSGLLALHLSI